MLSQETSFGSRWASVRMAIHPTSSTVLLLLFYHKNNQFSKHTVWFMEIPFLFLQNLAEYDDSESWESWSLHEPRGSYIGDRNRSGMKRRERKTPWRNILNKWNSKRHSANPPLIVFHKTSDPFLPISLEFVYCTLLCAMHFRRWEFRISQEHLKEVALKSINYIPGIYGIVLSYSNE